MQQSICKEFILYSSFISFKKPLKGEVKLWNIVQLQCFTHYLALCNGFFFIMFIPKFFALQELIEPPPTSA